MKLSALLEPSLVLATAEPVKLPDPNLVSEQIKSGAQKVAENPRVQAATHKAQETVTAQAAATAAMRPMPMPKTPGLAAPTPKRIDWTKRARAYAAGRPIAGPFTSVVVVPLKRQVKALRRLGFGFAVDDAGDG